MITREDRALPADQSPRPLSSSEQPAEKPSQLPRLHFPEQPGGQGLAPAPGAFPPPAPNPWGEPVPPPENRPGAPPEDALGAAPGSGPGAPPWNGPGTPPGYGPEAPPGYAPGSPGTPPDSTARWGHGPQPQGPGAPPRARPPRPPRPPRPTRPPEPTLRQRAYAALFLAVLSVIALFGIGSSYDFHRGIYLVVFALLVGLAACWLGATAMLRARRAASMRPRGAMLGTVFGALGAFISVFLLIFLAVFWSQVTTYSRCLGAANTLAVRQACQSQFNHSLKGEVGG